MATSYIPNKKIAVTINYQQLQANIDRWAKIALEEALDELTEKAKARAPVRDVFRRGPGRLGRPPERVPRGVFKAPDGSIQGRKIRHWRDSTRDRFLAQVNAQTEGTREVRVPTGGKTTSGRAKYRRIRGNQRSWQPVLGQRGARFTGEFRRVRINTAGQAVMSDTERFDAGKMKPSIQLGADTESSLLNARGRYELRRVNAAIDELQEKRLKRGEKKLTPREISGNLRLLSGSTRPGKKTFLKGQLPAVTGEGEGAQLFLGGRLRSEIYSTPATRRGDVLSGEVVSPTFYAKYQEYGTSHHRAQPYMRPALYEMRSRLRQHFVSAVRRERGA